MDPTHFLAQTRQAKPSHNAASRSEIEEFYQSVDWSFLRKLKAAVGVLRARLSRRPGQKASPIQRAPIVRGYPAE